MSDLSAVPSGHHEPEGAALPSTGLGELLRQCARGDERAFSQLYDEVSSRIFGLVLRVIRDRSQAEEVTQEVFVEIWRLSARFDRAAGSAITWMMTIAHRRAVDRVRSASAQTQRDQVFDAKQDRTFDSTSEHAEARLDAERVRRALTTLTETQRGAIELAFFGGYTHAEVATMLDIPLGTAKTRIRDGLIRLRDVVGTQS